MTKGVQLRLPIEVRANKVLRYIQAYQLENGVAPTLREIADEFEVTIRAAQVWVNLLVEQKRVDRQDKVIRGLRVREGQHGE